VIDAVTRAVRRVPPAWAVVAGIAVIVVAAGLTAGLAALGGPSPSPTPTAPVETPAASPTVASSLAPGASAASVGPVTSTVPAGWQPTFPIRAAFYYPWYPEAWKQQGLDPFTRYHPSLGFYDSSSSSVISEQIAAMQYGNISVGIASWWGQGTRTDVRLPAILAATGEAAFRWAVYYEPEGQGDPTPQQIRDDLTYIAAHYASDPAYLRVDGRFVVFAYANSGETCAMADRWAEANTVGAYVVLKVFNGFRTCQHQPDGWHQYGPAAADSSQRGYSYTISPGFAKATEASPRLTRDVERWTASIASMVASDAPWQLITTFNEWGEGTSVESASEWQSASGFGTYLDALHARGPAGIAPVH
jgi:Glycosyl hydrolase family 99